MEFLLTVKHAEGDEEEAVVPEGVVEIGEGAFRGMRQIRRVILPASCKMIGDYAFDGCRNLEEIVLPETLAGIGSFAFKNCSALERIVLPRTVASIPSQAFARCTKLAAVEGSEHLREIGIDAFTGCSSLRFFDASTAVSIGDRAFSGCRALERIELGPALRSIGHYAFRSCASLREIAIPDGVTQLGTNVFSGCRDIDVRAGESTICSHPDAFPRAATLAYGIIRPQDVRDLSAQFRRNHTHDTTELQARRAELLPLIDELQREVASLGVMDLKKRDAAVARLTDARAELEDVEALLYEIEHPSLRTLAEEFAGQK